MKGNRRYQPRHLSRKKKSDRAAASSEKDQALARLVFCAIVFVLLVVIKLLLPHSIDSLARTAGQLIGRDADFQAAFAAVGRAISGEEDVVQSLQDAYVAVFNPQGSQSEGGLSYTTAKEVFVPANRLVQYVDTPFPEKSDRRDFIQPTVPAGTTGEEVSTRSLSIVSSGLPLPENASLELRDLGFTCETPLRGTLTSTFGWRDHPVDNEEKFHYGLDIAADTGTAICAFADGKVYAAGESSTLGKYIMLEHSGGYVTLYAHCSRITARDGNVKMGEKIAEVGETGIATGPHLHFELRDGSLYLNPGYYVEVG